MLDVRNLDLVSGRLKQFIRTVVKALFRLLTQPIIRLQVELTLRADLLVVKLTSLMKDYLSVSAKDRQHNVLLVPPVALVLFKDRATLETSFHVPVFSPLCLLPLDHIQFLLNGMLDRLHLDRGQSKRHVVAGVVHAHPRGVHWKCKHALIEGVAMRGILDCMHVPHDGVSSLNQLVLGRVVELFV